MKAMRAWWHRVRFCWRNMHEWVRPEQQYNTSLLVSIGEAVMADPDERVCRWCGTPKMNLSPAEGVTQLGEFGEPKPAPEAEAWVITVTDSDGSDNIEPTTVLSMREARESFTMYHLQQYHYRKEDGTPGCNKHGDGCPGRMVR